MISAPRPKTKLTAMEEQGPRAVGAVPARVKSTMIVKAQPAALQLDRQLWMPQAIGALPTILSGADAIDLWPSTGFGATMG
jgi:hypothetical protein